MANGEGAAPLYEITSQVETYDRAPSGSFLGHCGTVRHTGRTSEDGAPFSVVDPGFAVDRGVQGAPDQPHDPDRPRYSSE